MPAPFRRPPSTLLPPALAGALLSLPGLVALFVLALALGEPMRAHADALVTPAAPLGILSLQFACAAEGAGAILAMWDEEARQHARLSLYWDMGFAPAYGIALAALSERFAAYRAGQGARRVSRWVSRLPIALGWLPLAAAAADMVENVLHLILIDVGGPAISTAACALALVKWGLLAAWLTATIVAMPRTLVDWLRRR